MKPKQFKVGDKVFAKVKGYPEWPAEVLEEKPGKKYNVKFYGTGETGMIKVDYMHYYLENKERFTKIAKKRKGFNEAIQEIEEAIKVNGTDGNEEQNGSVDDEVQTQSQPEPEKKGVKRRKSMVSEDKRASKTLKRSNYIVDSVPLKKDVNSQTPNTTKNGDNSSKDKLGEGKDKSEDVKIKVAQGNVEIIENNANSVHVATEEAATEAAYKIVTQEFLKSLVDYAAHVRKNERLYKGKTKEARSYSPNEVLVAKTPQEKFVGILLFNDNSFDSEYEQAVHDGKVAQQALAVKESVEKGLRKPEESPGLFMLNLKVDENEIQLAREVEIIDMMKVKLRWLKIEANLVQLDQKIKQNLGLEKAEPKTALKFMDEMLQLNVVPLMLKKQPHIVDIVRRLRKYVGNVKEWGLTGSTLSEFEADAKRIRMKALDLIKKFSELFSVSESNFFDAFEKELEDYKRKTADMSEKKILALHAEPDSRQAFLDQGQEGINDVLVTLGNKVDKENSSQAANLESKQEVLIENDVNDVGDLVDSTS